MERANMSLNEGNSMPCVMGRQNEMNGASQQLQNCFFNPSWDNSVDQSDPFESAVSSMVSSRLPAKPIPAALVSDSVTDNFVLRELIGRLGSVCNSAQVSGHSFLGANSNSTKTSCYSTPLNSPPELNLSVIDHQIGGNLPFHGNHLPTNPTPAGPLFADRSLRFSCFGSNASGGLNGQFGLKDSELTHKFAPKLDSGKLSRVSSNQSLKVADNLQDGNLAADQNFSRSPENGEFGDSRENSSVSEQIPGGEIGMNAQNDANSRKRKSISKGKGKDIASSPSGRDANAAIENNESSAKRSKQDEDNGSDKLSKPKAEQNGTDTAGNGSKKEAKDNQKPPEPPKDYIHVRARRGQATDAHSLAERVRREKISQRMKLLQDLVPGCNKVTGKAVMLDEIINYVQSLQRQVEFLSMKLASINPHMDVNLEALLSKDMFQLRGSLPQGVYPSDASASALPFSLQLQQSQNLHGQIPDGTKFPLAMPKNPSLQLPGADTYNETTASQVSTFWEDDLRTVVFGQNQTQNLHDLLSQAQMKPEL